MSFPDKKPLSNRAGMKKTVLANRLEGAGAHKAPSPRVASEAPRARRRESAREASSATNTGKQPMAGRKRKPGQREPNGRIKRASDEAQHAPAAVKRLIDAAMAKASDPRLGSEIGRLLLAGKLTTRQAAAGWRFAEVASAYQTAISAPALKSPRLERGQRGEAPEDGTPAGDAMTAATRRAVTRYMRADAVLSASGRDAERAARLLCADVALIGHQQLIDARSALDALAAHFAGPAR